MEFTAFTEHVKTADPTTRALLEGIIKDERRHIGFGENEIGRQLKATPWLAKRLRELRTELDPLVFASFEHAMARLDVPADQRADLGRAYLQAIERLVCRVNILFLEDSQPGNLLVLLGLVGPRKLHFRLSRNIALVIAVAQE